MKLLELFSRMNKSMIYNEYVNVTGNLIDYDKTTREKMLNQILKFYQDNPNRILEYFSEKELNLLDKLSKGKLKKYEYDNVYKSLHSKFFLVPETEGFSITEEFEDVVKKALENVDYKKIRKRDLINKRIIGLMKLYGICDVSLLSQMYTHYYNNDFKSIDECVQYITNSISLRYYIFIDGNFCFYNEYYHYLEKVFDNMDEKLYYKYFTKEEVESICNSKYNIDYKYVKDITKVFKENNIPQYCVDIFVDNLKMNIDTMDSIDKIEELFLRYMKLYSKNYNFKEELEKIKDIIINIPSVIYKGHSIKEILDMSLEYDSVKKAKDHFNKIGYKPNIEKYKKVRKESIEALSLCEEILTQDILMKYKRLFDINNVIFDMDSLLCHIVSFIPIDDEETLFYKYFRKHININNKYYEIFRDIKESNFSSLFLVKKMDSDNGTILLFDTKDKKDIKITDVSLSCETQLEGKYIYTSLFKIDGIYLTVGYIIPLMYDSYERVVKNLKIEERRIKGCKNKEMIRLLAAYKLYSKNDNVRFTTVDVI